MPNVEHIGQNAGVVKGCECICNLSQQILSQGSFLNLRVCDEGSIENVEKLVINLVHWLANFSQERCWGYIKN